MPDDITAHGTRYSAAALLARIAELEARFAAAPSTRNWAALWKRAAKGNRALMRDRCDDVDFEYAEREAAELCAARLADRIAVLESAIAVHRRDTATGCQVDAALWRVLEGGS